MDVDEALWSVEHLGPDLLPDAASTLAAEVRRLRAENAAMSLLVRRAARKLVFWRRMWRELKGLHQNLVERGDDRPHATTGGA